MRLLRLRTRHGVLAATAALLAACGGGGDGGTNNNPPPTPTITIAAGGASLNMAQGGNGTATITLTRGGGYTGAADLSLEGAPAGVTGTFSPTSIASGATTSTLTVTAAPTAAAGTSTLTVRAKGTGVTDATTTIPLTITAAATPAFTLALNPTTVSVEQGKSGTVAATVTRTGGFTGAVALSVSGAPTGVTATPNPASVTDTPSTITLAVGAAVAPGNYTLQVKGTGTGVTDQTAALTLTVTAAPASGSYTLAVSPTTVSVQQGAAGTASVNLTRTGGFTGAVALTASGAPNGVTVTFTPASVTNATSTMSIAVGAAVATGNYPITIKGTATGIADQTATLTLTVTAPSGGSGNVTFSFCGGITQLPIWVAFQDGASGAWTQVTASANNTYKFNITQGRGGIAYVTPAAGGGYSLNIFYATQAELTGQGGTVCGATPGSKTVNGTIAGTAPSDQVQVFLGGVSGTVLGSNYHVNNVPSGNVDLFAGKGTLTIGAGGVSTSLDKLIIRRNLNPADGSTLPVLDFGSNEAFSPSTNTLTINGLNAGEGAFVSMSYITPNGFAGTVADLTTGATHTLYGVPASQQAAGDLHGISVTATSTSGQPTNFRVYQTWYHTAADRTVALGPVLNTPTITTVASTPYVRLRIQLAQQPEYNKAMAATFTQGTGATLRTTTISATPAFLAGAAFDFTIPDFTGVGNFDPNWGMKAGAATTWTAIGYGWTGTTGIFAGTPADGAVVQYAARTGTFTP